MLISSRKSQSNQGGLKTLAGFSTFSSTGQDEIDPQEYARLLDLYDNSFRNIAEGEVVKGTVLKVTAVGSHRRRRLQVRRHHRRSTSSSTRTGQVTVQPGDIVDVLLERTEDREGYVVLSREKAEKMKIWDEVEKAYAERKVVIGRVIERIKGGLAVDIGVRAFLPGIADRRASRAQPGRAARPGTAHARHQGQQEARQHRALAQGAPRRGERREEEAHARHAGRGQGARAASSRTSPTTARSSTSAASTACCTSPTCRGAASAHPVRALQGQRRNRRDRAQVRPGDRARLARPQAAHHRSLGERHRALPGRRARRAARS